jgi:hypothetical protein
MASECCSGRKSAVSNYLKREVLLICYLPRLFFWQTHHSTVKKIARAWRGQNPNLRFRRTGRRQSVHGYSVRRVAQRGAKIFTLFGGGYPAVTAPDGLDIVRRTTALVRYRGSSGSHGFGSSFNNHSCLIVHKAAPLLNGLGSIPNARKASNLYAN